MASLGIEANNPQDLSMVPAAGPTVLVVSHLLAPVVMLVIPGQVPQSPENGTSPIGLP